MSLKVHTLPIFDDNYVFLLESGSDCAIVDPGEFKNVDTKLMKLSLKPKYKSVHKLLLP